MTTRDQAADGEVINHRCWKPFRVLAALLLTLPLLAAFSSSAVAQTEQDSGVAVVLQVSGLLDPLLADFVIDGIENADDEGAKVVVLQLNSTGAVISDDELNELAEVISSADVPVTMWVGPSGARATGPWAEKPCMTIQLGGGIQRLADHH